MRKYFTTLEKVNDMLVGTVRDPNTNAVVHTTQPYSSQTQVMDDINAFITNSRPLETAPNNTSVVRGETIINTMPRTSVTGSGRSCCGR